MADRPDTARREQEIERLKTRITNIRGKITEISDAMKAENEKAKGNNPRTQLTQEVKKLSGQINAKQEDVKSFKEQVRELDDQKKAGAARLQGSGKDQFKTVAEVDAAIKQIELRQETSGSGSIKSDRKFMQRIKDLEALKDEVKLRDTVETDLKRVKEDRDGLLAKLTAAVAELETMRDQRTEIRNKLDALGNSKEDQKFKQWKEEREHYQKQITECQEQITAVREKFNKQMDAWRKKQQEEREKKQKEWEAKKAKQEQEFQERKKLRAEREEQRRIKDQEKERLAMMNPHEAEIDCCKNLISFLEAQKGQARTRVEAASFDATAAAPKDGLKVVKRSDDDDWLYGDRRKKAAKAKEAREASTPAAAPKPKKEAGNRPIAMTGQRMQAFGKVKVAVPRQSGQIDAALAELREKMAKWESAKRSEEEVDAELKAKAEAKAAKAAAEAAAAAEAGAEEAPAAEAEAEAAEPAADAE